MTIGDVTTSEPGLDGPNTARWLRPVLLAGVAWTLAWAILEWALLPRLAADPRVSGQVAIGDWVFPAVALVMVGIGGLVLLRDRTHSYGWLLFAAGIVKGTEFSSGAYALYALEVVPESGLPLGVVTAWFHDAVLTPAGSALVVLLLPGLFPDGRVVAGRWGAALRLTLGSWIAYSLVYALTIRPLEGWFYGLAEPPANPTGFLALPIDPLGAWWALTFVASVVVSVGSIVVRWRRAGAEVRQQMKWPLLGFLLLAALFLVEMVSTGFREVASIDLGLQRLSELGNAVLPLLFVAALGLGVLKYRLYDVDRVINRTLVYTVLTVAVVAVYVLGVLGVGRLMPSANEQGLALGTTIVVALAFDPVRRRVQTAANRWMFGQRDDPYAVLSHLGGVMAEAGTPGETLQSVVDTVAESLKLPWVTIELDQREGPAVRVLHGTDEPTVPESVPLVHRDEVVGHLLAAPRSDNEPLGPADLRLLADIARQAGAVAATARLTEDLQRSREELVLAREEERRRIRRDLHDGLGPTLAAQTLVLDAAADRVVDDPAVARDLLVGLKQETQDLVAEIRRLVHQLRPPALDELGLAGALVAQVTHVDGAGQVAVRIRTQPDPLPELPAAVEVAAWRISREAMANVLRHADATTCLITLTAHHDALEVRVVDDGIGLPIVPRAGVGLASMRERAEELGGTFHATDRGGGGSEVVAVLPTTTAVHAIAGPGASTAITTARP